MKQKSIAMLLVFALASVAQPAEFFEIQTIDSATGRGIPLVELETVNHIRLVSDSAGNIAFHEPGLMDRDVFFFVNSSGYEFPADGFGMRGRTLRTTPGTIATLRLKRKNLAERICRVTGEGIYRDSVLLGKAVPLDEPLLNAGVLGSDSVLTAEFQNRLYWFWGDTNLAKYPLGLFHTPGATSPLPTATQSFQQSLNLQYFTDTHHIARNTAEMSGTGPTWLSGLTVLIDENGQQRMFAGFAKIQPPLTAYQRGIAEFDLTTNRFHSRGTFPLETPAYPDGHPLLVNENGQQSVYFARPFPDVRVAATPERFLDVSQYEAYTYLASGSTLEAPVVERKDDGTLAYSWKRNAPPRDFQLEQRLLKAGELKQAELELQLRSPSGQPVIAHSGSVYWNDYRQRYVMIALEALGDSPLGEIWYSESEHLPGNWSPAVKIVSHENYSFYNPKQHPYFAEDGGRVIYFEGTYTHTFTNNTHPTPRYDYNQVLYRLDLGDNRLRLKQ